MQKMHRNIRLQNVAKFISKAYHDYKRTLPIYNGVMPSNFSAT